MRQQISMSLLPQRALDVFVCLLSLLPLRLAQRLCGSAGEGRPQTPSGQGGIATPASSSVAAARNMRASSNAGPIICKPIGKPAPLNPHGIDTLHPQRRGDAE